MTSVIKIRAQRKKMGNSIKLSKGQLHEKWKNRLFLYFCTFPTLICALFPLYGPYFSGQLKQRVFWKNIEWLTVITVRVS